MTSKLLLTVFLFVSAINSRADNYISGDGLAACKSGDVYTVFRKSGNGRFEIPEDFNCGYFDLAEVEEDDPSQPLGWADPSRIDDCIDQNACLENVQSVGYCQEGDSSFWGDLDDDESLESWCTHMKYGKHMVRRFVENASDKAAWQAIEDAKSAVQVEIGNRKQAVRSLVQNWDDATAAQVKQAVRYLLMKDLRE